MGFMDRFKEMAGQAQDAAKSAGGSVASMGGLGGAASEAEKANRIAQVGVQTPAVLRSITPTGNKDPLSGGEEFALEVEVRPPSGDSYPATFTQQLVVAAIETYQGKVSSEITVRVDPDDPNSMLLWGRGPLRARRNRRAPGTDPRARRQPADLGAAARAAHAHARRHRSRPAWLRPFARAARRRRPLPGQPRRRGHRALRRARARTPAPGRQLARRVGRARAGKGRAGGDGVRDLARRPLAPPPRPARSRRPRPRAQDASAARNADRLRARTHGHAADDARAAGAAQPRRGLGADRGLARLARLQRRECRDAHQFFEHPEQVTVPTTIARATRRASSSRRGRSCCRARRPLHSPRVLRPHAHLGRSPSGSATLLLESRSEAKRTATGARGRDPVGAGAHFREAIPGPASAKGGSPRGCRMRSVWKDSIFTSFTGLARPAPEGALGVDSTTPLPNCAQG